MALDRDHYQCQDCLALKRAGARIRVRPATVVHHIKPKTEYPDLAMDIDNLLSLCDACHNKRHPEKGGQNARRQEAPAGVRVVKV